LQQSKQKEYTSFKTPSRAETFDPE